MKITIAAFCLGVFLALSAAAFAEAPVAASVKAPTASPESRAAEIREKMMSRLRISLELTDDQAQKLGAAMDAWHGQMKQRREAFQQQFKALLTPEQQATAEKMRQEREQRMTEWHTRREAQKAGDAKPGAGSVTVTATARRGHMAKGWQSLNLTTDQSKKARALANQMRHLMKADSEMMLAQASMILSPLQEKEFEATLTRLLKQQKERRSIHGPTRTERGKSGHPTSMAPSSDDDEEEASVEPIQTTL